MAVRRLGGYLLSCATFLANTSQVEAQFNVYHPFPDSNAVWGMTTSCTEFPCGGDWAYLQSYYAGDTVLNGLSYKQVQSTVLPMTQNQCCFYASGIVGFLREDTVSRKVYWRDQWITTDTLLYDFTLQIGDTLGGFSGACQTWVVNAIDSVLVGQNYRKRLHFTSSPNIPDSTLLGGLFIIEGVGSSRGLVDCFVDFWFPVSSTCFAVDGEVVYAFLPDSIACGELPTGTGGWTGTRTLPLQVIPNPATGLVTLRFSKADCPVQVTVYDLMGKELLRLSPNRVDHVILDVTGLPAGVYVVQVQGKGAVILRGKMIKS